jgi:hypothetical protein
MTIRTHSDTEARVAYPLRNSVHQIGSVIVKKLAPWHVIKREEEGTDGGEAESGTENNHGKLKQGCDEESYYCELKRSGNLLIWLNSN